MTTGEAVDSIEFALVRACLHGPRQPADAQRLRQLAQQPIDWPHLLAIAQHHKVAPMVARALDACAWECLPEKVSAQLRAGNIENAHICLRRIGHLLSLTQMFAKHSIAVRIF